MLTAQEQAFAGYGIEAVLSGRDGLIHDREIRPEERLLEAHQLLGELLVAILVLPIQFRNAALEPVELTRWVGERLAYFKVPAHWELRRSALPRNAAGKVIKHLLDEGSENPYQEE